MQVLKWQKPGQYAGCNDSGSDSADIEAVLHFYSPPRDKSNPFFKVTHQSGAGVKNYSHDARVVRIRDMRPVLDFMKLDTHSFSGFMNVEPFTFLACNDLQSSAAILQKDVETFLQDRIPGRQKIIPFDYVIRRANKEEKFCRPVRKVHIDQTPCGAWKRAERHLDSIDYASVQQGERFRILNIWRPINRTVLDHPLALAASDTIQQEHLVEIEHIYPDRSGQTYGVKYGSAQQFWWWPKMTTTDVLLFQCFDSQRDVRCAHASFEDPGNYASQGRESVEVRCIVLG